MLWIFEAKHIGIIGDAARKAGLSIVLSRYGQHFIFAAALYAHMFKKRNLALGVPRGRITNEPA